MWNLEQNLSIYLNVLLSIVIMLVAEFQGGIMISSIVISLSSGQMVDINTCSEALSAQIIRLSIFLPFFVI